MNKPTTVDDKHGGNEQDTPGRPKSSSSRQQTRPDQGTQSGNPEIDSKTEGKPRHNHHVRNEK
jgi:hypothetical protein